MKLLRRKKKNRKMSKNMMRTLTSREKTLITFLAIIIMFWASSKYIINPQMIKISTLENQINDYTIKIKNHNKMFKYEKLRTEEMNELTLEREIIRTGLFKNLGQPEIIYVLNDLLLKSNIEMESITLSEPIVEMLNGKEILKLEVSIPFIGDFQSLVKTVEEIEEVDRKIVISDIEIEKNEDLEIVGNINLSIYSLNELVKIEEKDIDIQVIENNKLNPFVPYKGYTDNLPEDLVDDVEKPENQNLEENRPIIKEEYDTYKSIKGDNISYISVKEYGNERYVDEILRLNNMIRSSILPIGKEIKLIKK